MKPCASLLVVVVLLLAGCGEEVPDLPVERATPAVTAPTGAPYENGGADGSGADGSEESNRRGGIAAGADNKALEEEPGSDENESPTVGEFGE